ncbi:hypothetical protein EVAR_103499_1 [Eumeta japonica]|uniref:Uncharacterized protein n=1 Tax=Eumeta variegata TaxID=151549 RepID=A0A4C1ZHS3_EUMVA|nr:hypothetical protein EVAR_103499_1 [Eumeta japonica]
MITKPGVRRYTEYEPEIAGHSRKKKPTHTHARRGSFMAAERATFGHTRRTGQCRRIISVDKFDEAPSTPTVHHTYPISSYTRKCTGYS